MMCSHLISTFVSRLAVSLALLVGGACGAAAQGMFKIENDSVPLFRGFSVGVDLVGAAQLMLSDYGQWEASAFVNLHDQYYPTVEVGIGKGDHSSDAVTGISYNTSAPYFRVGCDVNIMKKKHTGNRIYVGLRYGFTSYKVDVARPVFEDPVWHWDTHYGVSDEQCSQHWAEVVFGLDAKVVGPVHMGWSVRYRRRLSHNDDQMDNSWYVPGFGRQGGTRLGAAFLVSIEL